MRKMVLWVIIISLLQTQVFYGAVEVIETQPTTSLWQRCVDKVAFWRSSSDSIVDPIERMESGILVEAKLPEYQESKPSLLAEYVDSVKGSVSAFVNHPAGICIVTLGGFCVFFGALFILLVSLVGFFDDLPFSVAITQITHPMTSSYQALDICQNFLVADTRYLEHVRSFSKYEHVSSRDGVAFLDALPGWLNNAHNLLALFSAYILSERTMDRSQQMLPYKLRGDFSNLLFAYGVDMHNHNYMCSFSKGNNGQSDSITGCQLDSKKDLYESEVDFSDEADAVIQFRLWDNKYNFRHPSDLSVRISVNLTPLKKQLHPVLNYFPYLGQGEDTSRFSVQRRLMQEGSSSGSPDAVKDRVENNLEVMGQLNAMLHKLRLWESVGENEAALLSALVRSDFTTNQIALTSDIGCDLDLVKGLFNLLSCFQGNRPAIAEGTRISNAAQVWFLRESSGAVSQVMAIANKAPVVEAMAVWLKQSTVVVSNLWEIADALYHRVCTIAGDAPLNLLMSAAQNELVNHGAGLQRDLGCDIRFNDGDIKEMVCYGGTAPFVPEGCALESNVTVRWDGKLWLKHDNLKPCRVSWAAVSVNPVWHSSRSATRPYSPSLLAGDEVTRSGTAITDSVENTDEITKSGTAITESVELTDEVTRSGTAITDSVENTDEITRSGTAITDSVESTDEVAVESTASASRTHSPSLLNVDPAQDEGITGLYYVDYDSGWSFTTLELSLDRSAFTSGRSTSYLKKTFLTKQNFGNVPISWSNTIQVFSKLQKVCWSVGIYLTGPSSYQNIRRLYVGINETGTFDNFRSIWAPASSTPLYQNTLSKFYIVSAARKILLTYRTGAGMEAYVGDFDIGLPADSVKNLVPISGVICANSGANYGLHYYHNRTQKLLWSCDSELKLSTLNFLSNSGSDTESWPFSQHGIQDVSYDAKNKRLFILSYTYARDDTFYAYNFDIENPTAFGNATEFTGFTSNNDYHQGSISVASD